MILRGRPSTLTCVAAVAVFASVPAFSTDCGTQVTCGVAKSVLDKVLVAIKRSLDAGGVRARMITSGTGDWRFLDIVSVRAGKLEVCSWRLCSTAALFCCYGCSTCCQRSLRLLGIEPWPLLFMHMHVHAGTHCANTTLCDYVLASSALSRRCWELMCKRPCSLHHAGSGVRAQAAGLPALGHAGVRRQRQRHRHAGGQEPRGGRRQRAGVCLQGSASQPGLVDGSSFRKVPGGHRLAGCVSWCCVRCSRRCSRKHTTVVQHTRAEEP